MKWVWWHTLIWVVWIVAFLWYEIWAGVDHDSRTPMLTEAVVRYVPGWITLPFVAWLFFHFLVRYLNLGYLARLRGLA